MKPEVIIYCDGACSPNPGIGGWGALLISPRHAGFTKEISGAELDTTNNRMELTAVVEALRRLKEPSRIRVFTDSEYLRNAFAAGWLAKWQRNGWKTSPKQSVANQDLWVVLASLAAPHDIEWNWVRGHAGDPNNTRADSLAVTARLALARSLEVSDPTPDPRPLTPDPLTPDP
jgi:ribonuclease HI